MRGRVSPTTKGSSLNTAVVLLVLAFGGCSESERVTAEAPPAASPPPAPPEREAVQPTQPAPYHQTGIASWYGGRHQGRPTASGARFDMHALTAAHRFLPLGTLVLVENLANGRRIALTITDRGPYVAGRIIDLSLAAARSLGLERSGVGLVRVTLLSSASPELVASGR